VRGEDAGCAARIPHATPVIVGVKDAVVLVTGQYPEPITIKNDFVPWTWSQVSQGDKVYAIPQDSGPMGLLYRTDIFAQYHLPVPTTWAQSRRRLLRCTRPIHRFT